MGRGIRSPSEMWPKWIFSVEVVMASSCSPWLHSSPSPLLDRQTDSFHVNTHVPAYQILLLKSTPPHPHKKKISKESLDVSWEVTSLVYSVETPPRWTWHRLCLCFMSVDRFLLWTTYLVCAGSSSSDALRCTGALGQGHHCVVSVSTGLTVRVTCLVKSRPKLLFSA